MATDAVTAYERSESTVSISGYRMVTIDPLTTGINPIEYSVPTLHDSVV